MGAVDSSVDVLGGGSVVACEVHVLEEVDVSSGAVDSTSDVLGVVGVSAVVAIQVLEEVDVSCGMVDSSIDVLGGGSVVACEVEVLETTNRGIATGA